MLVIIVGIGAPIAEEIFYRGLALGAMQRRWGATWGLVASSGLFALTHNQPLQFPALLAFGLVLGWMVQRTGRLGPAVWAHLGFNMTAALALVLDLDLPG
ncbi:MAG: CPBP family intramembrane metalloprotease [Acidimicrobiales bacterium]|nr:CPBP family intramembrane metalloprotease [Acidimicrobiales bacterium]